MEIKEYVLGAVVGATIGLLGGYGVWGYHRSSDKVISVDGLTFHLEASRQLYETAKGLENLKHPYRDASESDEAKWLAGVAEVDTSSGALVVRKETLTEKVTESMNELSK